MSTTWKRTVLVVANVTASSEELVSALKAQAESQPTSYTMVVPATPFGGGRDAAKQNLDEALSQLRDAGLEVDGTVGHPDPIVAVSDTWDPRRYDEIIVSTLPMGLSKWLHAGLPERIEKLTGAPVTHLVSQPPKDMVQAEPAPSHEDRGVMMGPLSVLGWGGQKKD